MTTSLNGAPLVKGDRVLYVCQCGARLCPTGQRATVLDVEELMAHFPGSDERPPEGFVPVKFDNEDLPCGAQASDLVHLSALNVPEDQQGPVERPRVEARVLLVDDATVDQVPTMTDMANIVVHVGSGEVLKHSDDFSRVFVATPESSLRQEAQNVTVKEAFLALGFAIAHPNNN